jgi:hypothetical protein
LLTAETQHVLLPPLDVPVDMMEAGRAAGASGSKPTSTPPASAAAFCGSAEDLLEGEMISDYLEKTAADDVDREHIKKNEFRWLLSNTFSELEAEGLLPPRFADISSGLVFCKLTPPAKDAETGQEEHLGKAKEAQAGKSEQGRPAQDSHSSRGISSKKRAADGALKHTRGVRAGELEASSSAGLAPHNGDEEIFYSVLKPRVGLKLGACEKERCELVWRWLRHKLHHEVEEQAFAVSRGLREVIPPGLLALFSAPELQALLGGGAQVSDAGLAEWKASTEYGNGLKADNERVAWFWEAVEAMDAGSRASVWKFGTGLTRLIPAARGGCAALQPAFNIVNQVLPGAASSKAPACHDSALVSAATCHNQLQLPTFSSAEVRLALGRLHVSLSPLSSFLSLLWRGPYINCKRVLR